MKNTYNSNTAPTGVSVPVSTETKLQVASRKFKLNTAEQMVLATMLAMPVFAHADGGATFSLDISSIITGITTLIALVTSVGLAFLSVTLVIKAFKYIKTAM